MSEPFACRRLHDRAAALLPAQLQAGRFAPLILELPADRYDPGWGRPGTILDGIGRQLVQGEADCLGRIGADEDLRATALEPSRLAILSRKDFLSFVQGNANVALEMLSALAHRLRRTDELLQNRITRNVNEEEAAHLTFGDRAADVIAEFGGSWKFIIASLALFVVWVSLNTILLTRIPFDPFPFILLNLALNMITALQAPIIMMSQNRQSHKDRLRADLDYAVNLKNELALNEMLQRLQVLERDCLRLTARKAGHRQGERS